MISRFGDKGTPHETEIYLRLQRVDAVDQILAKPEYRARAMEMALKLAITTRWSNGSVEGHIPRLKVIKRQMYRRASFQLLRAPVLPWSYPQLSSCCTENVEEPE